jgi:hypothetical protein
MKEIYNKIGIYCVVLVKLIELPRKYIMGPCAKISKKDGKVNKYFHSI